MAALVIGHGFLLVQGHEALALDAADHALGRDLEVQHLDLAFVVAGCQDGCLVAKVCDLCTAETWGQSGQTLRIFLFCVFCRKC